MAMGDPVPKEGEILREFQIRAGVDNRFQSFPSLRFAGSRPEARAPLDAARLGDAIPKTTDVRPSETDRPSVDARRTPTDPDQIDSALRRPQLWEEWTDIHPPWEARNGPRLTNPQIHEAAVVGGCRIRQKERCDSRRSREGPDRTWLSMGPKGGVSARERRRRDTPKHMHGEMDFGAVHTPQKHSQCRQECLFCPNTGSAPCAPLDHGTPSSAVSPRSE